MYFLVSFLATRLICSYIKSTFNLYLGILLVRTVAEQVMFCATLVDKKRQFVVPYMLFDVL